MGDVESSWRELCERVEVVCRQTGREPSQIRIIAVSKLQSLEKIREALGAGITDLGENRIQEALAKIPLLTPRPTWHLVGHLQTNKANKAARLFDWVQSVDSVRLALALGQAARLAGRQIRVLIQVNSTSEGEKSGCDPEEMEPVIEAVTEQAGLELAGLMTIGPLSMEEKPTRAAFRLAAQLREKWRPQLPAGSMAVLSMGMSGDWPWALEYGADWLRIGTAIFGTRGGKR